MRQINPSYLFFFLLVVSFHTGIAQVKFSMATDFSVMHNFDGKQSFTSAGQTVIPQFHFEKRNTVYFSFSYHSSGKYRNTLAALAKSPTTQPQSFSLTNRSEMRLRQFSVGVRRYLVGFSERLEKFNLYTGGGFGIILGRASNTFSSAVDTNLYSVQYHVLNGVGKFKRLTFDVVAGAEFPVAYEIFIYTETRLHIPTTDYPSNYLLKNNSPFPATFNIGFRILFDADP